MNEDKPLKIRLSGSVRVKDETVTIQSGGLSIL